MTRDELERRLETDLHRLTTEMDVPGVSVALSSGPHVVEATSGVVNTRAGVAVTPDALFQIQSITKIFTATLVMQLIDDGLVELDEPVQTYLPAFHTADAGASARITVRHLLTHTAGFDGDLWQPTTAETSPPPQSGGDAQGAANQLRVSLLGTSTARTPGKSMSKSTQGSDSMQTATTLRTVMTTVLAAVVAAATFTNGTATAYATTYPGPQGPRDVHGAIEQEWLHLRADPGAFQPGAPLTDELRTPIKTGAFNHFERASIYWSPTTGAHEVHGDFRTWWASLGWENSYLGFPLTGELPAAGGVYQRFQGGQAYWSAETGAHAVHGDFFTYYTSQGWERSWLGYPLTRGVPHHRGGRAQR